MLLFHDFYCNRLQLIDKNNFSQVIATIFSFYMFIAGFNSKNDFM